MKYCAVAIPTLECLSESALSEPGSERGGKTDRESFAGPTLPVKGESVRWVSKVLAKWAFVCFCSFVWLSGGRATAQLTVGPAPVAIAEATQVVEQWRPEQHLYVKGELGVRQRQLDELEQWLDENGPNWTVVLMDDTVGERYRGTDGRLWEGMDAVEQALGRGLSNRTQFGTLEDSRTGESNGAVFALSLGDRSFSYFASDVQDRRGLGESQWRGRLDRPAYEAMANGGRIIDAVKNTVTSINGAVDKAIAAEEQARQNEEREQQRTRERIELLIERIQAATSQVQEWQETFVGENPTAKGELARPPLEEWRERLDTIHGDLDKGENLVRALQRAGTLMDEIGGVLLAYREDKAFPNRWQALQASVQSASAGPNNVARPTLNQAQAALAEAQSLKENGDRQSVTRLEDAERLWKQAGTEVKAEEERLERQARQRRLRATWLLPSWRECCSWPGCCCGCSTADADPSAKQHPNVWRNGARKSVRRRTECWACWNEHRC